LTVRRWSAAVGAVVLSALLLAVAAVADKEQIHYTAAGQAAARAAVLTRADLGASGSWTGGHKKVDVSSGPLCAGFDPKQSDLVLNGASHTEFTQPGIDIDSEAQVLQTPHMVSLDWQRTVLSPKVIPCLREVAAKSLGAGAKVVSIKRVAFPRVATYTAAVRIVLQATSGTTTVKIYVDIVLVGRGHTEITLSTTAPLAAASVLRPAEVRLAKLLVARAT
jgi:hypothetical protein